jgi:hypothetical protein
MPGYFRFTACSVSGGPCPAAAVENNIAEDIATTPTRWISFTSIPFDHHFATFPRCPFAWQQAGLILITGQALSVPRYLFGRANVWPQRFGARLARRFGYMLALPMMGGDRAPRIAVLGTGSACGLRATGAADFS